MMIRSIVILAAITAFVSGAHAEETHAPPATHHLDPVWYEWDSWAEEDRIPNPAYVQTTAELVVVGSIPPAPRVAPSCHVRTLEQGSGVVRICE
jgi:hypothetical protein